MSEGSVSVSCPAMVPLKDTEKLINSYAVLFRNDQKVPGRIIRVDVEGKRIIYELLGGVDKGKKMSSRYDESQMAKLYDFDNVILACLET